MPMVLGMPDLPFEDFPENRGLLCLLLLRLGSLPTCPGTGQGQALLLPLSPLMP
jgi:hypothetical protein